VPRLAKALAARTDAELPASADITAHVTQLCVGAFADFCAIYLRSRGSGPVAFASSDLDQYERLKSAPYDDAYTGLARELGVGTVLVEPLSASGPTLGTIVAGIATHTRLNGDAAVVLARLASIVSIAVEQSEQLSHHYRISKRLQSAMLPERLASGKGLAFDAAYRPASAETDVGGDWYDAFDIGNGTIGVSVGDVIGHGLEAAVAMSEIRSAIRATAATAESPSALINQIDDMMVGQSVGLATAVMGMYSPDTGVFRYASAGHPPPVLLAASGRALWLPGGGAMLGLGVSPASDDVTVTIPAAGTVFLYTDGLLEYGRDVIEGERALHDAVEGLVAIDGRYAQALHEALFANGTTNVDDCATLALHRTRNVDARHERFTYSSIPLCATLARESLRQFIERFDLDSDRQFDFITAVGEAVANAIEHGVHDPGCVFDVDARADPGSISVEIRSPGHWLPFTPSTERGRGIPIMRSCANNLEVASTQEETRVTLSFESEDYSKR
jgi:serine/threonine-protein kinase RsbW